jgi:hypothetical protein
MIELTLCFLLPLPEKLVFEDNSYRTIPYRKVIERICRPGKGLRGPENKESPENSELFNVVPGTGILKFWRSII